MRHLALAMCVGTKGLAMEYGPYQPGVVILPMKVADVCANFGEVLAGVAPGYGGLELAEMVFSSASDEDAETVAKSLGICGYGSYVESFGAADSSTNRTPSFAWFDEYLSDNDKMFVAWRDEDNKNLTVTRKVGGQTTIDKFFSPGSAPTAIAYRGSLFVLWTNQQSRIEAVVYEPDGTNSGHGTLDALGDGYRYGVEATIFQGRLTLLMSRGNAGDLVCAATEGHGFHGVVADQAAWLSFGGSPWVFLGWSGLRTRVGALGVSGISGSENGTEYLYVSGRSDLDPAMVVRRYDGMYSLADSTSVPSYYPHGPPNPYTTTSLTTRNSAFPSQTGNRLYVSWGSEVGELVLSIVSFWTDDPITNTNPWFTRTVKMGVKTMVGVGFPKGLSLDAQGVYYGFVGAFGRPQLLTCFGRY